MTLVWVLDWVGYDARGGSAKVFSSREAAKAAAPEVNDWRPSQWTAGEEFEHRDDTSDARAVYPVVLDEGPLPEWLAEEQARIDEAYRQYKAKRNAAWVAEHPIVKLPSGAIARRL